MKSIFFVLSLLCIALHGQAQYNDDVLSYYINGMPVNGVKIKTNLPFTNSTQMPTIMVEGYSYNTGEPINLILNYYITGNAFVKSSVSSAGSYNPPITLAAENGKVVIFIDSRIFYLRFHVRAFANGRTADIEASYTGWTAVDSTLSSTATASFLVPYQNRFSGDVYMPGSSIWKSNGYVGIGTATPGYSLDIYTSYQRATSAAIRHQSSDGHFILMNPSSAGGNYNNLVQSGDLAYIFSGGTPGTGAFVLAPYAVGPSGLRMDSLGNVAIGTAFPKSYKLAVEGTIGTRRLKITQQSDWSDFVFQSDYQLTSLQDVEKYINTNKHLSGIPSAEDVQKEGFDVGEMNKLLLQKVEELTLYMIEEHKQKQKMQDQIDALQRNMKTQK
jgi:hypothetical protein